MDEQPRTDPNAPASAATAPIRLLWANPYCLCDTSSGASLAIRQILIDLTQAGFDIKILGATIFDAPSGTSMLGQSWDVIQHSNKKVVTVKDGVLRHELVKTRRTERSLMAADEEATWFVRYTTLLDSFKPDVVFYYGGRTLDLLIGYEAQYRNIKVVAYLGNGNYRGTRWCRHVDLILTDSQATAQLYKDRDGLDVIPIGPVIDFERVKAPVWNPKYVLLVNPSLAKGAAVVIAVALMMESMRPDIRFRVVKSRGDWDSLVGDVMRALGQTPRALTNVDVIENTPNMAPIYAETRLLLAPSLWWESFGRVVLEAQSNGIPCIVSDRGGLPEAVGDGGDVISFPKEMYEQPYNKIPKQPKLKEVVDLICSYFDDPEVFADKSTLAQLNQSNFSQGARGDRLLACLTEVTHLRVR